LVDSGSIPTPPTRIAIRGALASLVASMCPSAPFRMRAIGLVLLVLFVLVPRGGRSEPLPSSLGPPPRPPAVVELDECDDAPELSGLDVCRSIRRTEGLRPIPLILLTAKSKGSETAEALESGADDHLSKPYDLVELQARIRLGIRRLEKATAVGSKLGTGQDLLLQRILCHFLPLNRMALETVMEDPSRLDAPVVGHGRCDLSHVVRETISQALRFLADQVRVSVNGESVEVAVSADSLRQILLNVLVHVRMASADRPGNLDISWHEGGDGVVLRCEDDGPRVLPEDITLLGWPATTMRNQGSNPGFGLFFANLAAESAGGSISCSSPAGKGLRIEIRLPKA